MTDFLKGILIGLAGVILGVFLNTWIRDYENKNFLSLLMKKLNQLQEKEKISALNVEEQKQMDKLKSEIYILKFKCQA